MQNDEKDEENYRLAKADMEVKILTLFAKLVNTVSQYRLRGYPHTANLGHMCNELFEMAEDFHYSTECKSSWRDK